MHPKRCTGWGFLAVDSKIFIKFYLLTMCFILLNVILTLFFSMWTCCQLNTNISISKFLFEYRYECICSVKNILNIFKFLNIF